MSADPGSCETNPSDGSICADDPRGSADWSGLHLARFGCSGDRSKGQRSVNPHKRCGYGRAPLAPPPLATISSNPQ